jgi:hypothetical protein
MRRHADAQVLSSTASTFGVTVTGNSIRSDGTAGSVGIYAARSGGFSIAMLLIATNFIRATDTGVSVDAAATEVCYLTGLNSATTKVVGAVAGAGCN